MTNPASDQTYCGIAALVGAPNAGKSTLLNLLVGSKVSIVSRKVQTTRTRVRGIAIDGKVQVVLCDTPGIFTPKRRLDRAMVQAAWAETQDADVTVLLADAAKGLDDEVKAIVDGLKAQGKKAVLALNKIDLIRRDRLLAVAAAFQDTGAIIDVFMISALTGDGVDDLRKYLAKAMPPGPWLYPEDQAADVTERLLAAEVTREQLYDKLHDELPYQSAVETTAFQERKDGSARIEQTIYVSRDTQRAIVLGEKGRTIKAIGASARKELTRLLGRPIHLFLHVKVQEGWADDPERYRDIGLEFPKS